MERTIPGRTGRPDALPLVRRGDDLTSGAGWLRLDNEGGSVNTYKTAWHCPACRKLVVDTAGILPKGEWPELGQTDERFPEHLKKDADEEERP